MPISINTYKTNFYKLVAQLIPSQLLQPKMYRWCKALVSPSYNTVASIVAFRKQKLYHLSITPQVFSLEKVLNDKFDTTHRRIFISEGENDKRVYCYKRTEDNPLHIYTRDELKPVYVYKRNELTTTSFDFVLNVPAALNSQIDTIKSVLDIYKLQDKTYKIQLF